MKLFLFIIFWMFVPTITPDGIQIGEILFNNQKIKIMKMNFNNPAWLQSASNVSSKVPETRFVFVEGENQVQLSSNGDVIIESVQGGEKVHETYSALNDTNVTINADEGTEVVIYGAVTKFVSTTTYPHNTIKYLDVSKNNALTYLDCNTCTGLTSLDVSKNTALTYLNCNTCTGLTSLDVSKNTALTYLNCYGCTGVTSLDVSKNTALTSLDCGGCTGLTSLDVSKNTALTSLNCYGCTGVTSLDVSKNTALTSLYCYGCTGVTSLDVSKNTALTSLDCNTCTGLTSLDVSKNTALTSLYCYDLPNILMLNIKNTAALENGTILDQSMANLTTLQVAGTSAWAYVGIESWLSDYAPDNGTIYVDENTPQGVITEAQGKSWTVEYVNQ